MEKITDALKSACSPMAETPQDIVLEGMPEMADAPAMDFEDESKICEWCLNTSCDCRW